MRYRKLVGPNFDYVLGHGEADFYVDQPEAVAQSVFTRLRLITGEWFIATDQGTPYFTEVIGANTARTRDTAIRQRIVTGPGVSQLLAYQSLVNPVTRAFGVAATVLSEFSTEPITIMSPVPQAASPERVRYARAPQQTRLLQQPR